ncbi:GSCOCG00000605001-RA-CDS [Cotesia congregata]|nr:GSCOCG00000605001-RA-CDS [Cotesia congregata]
MNGGAKQSLLSHGDLAFIALNKPQMLRKTYSSIVEYQSIGIIFIFIINVMLNNNYQYFGKPKCQAYQALIILGKIFLRS